MKLHPRLSRAAVELVTRFETFQPQAQPAAVGGWTVGYGHTRSAREGAHVTRADAEVLLLFDLSAAAEGVEAALFAPVTQRQFEALTAFAFNIGADNFRRSTALARINGGAELEAADEIERWRHAELGAGAQVVDALVRRRAAEKAHFLGLPEGFSKSPSAVLLPLAIEGGHEPEPPPIEIAAAPSATLSAANTVQARLRELVPDPDPAPSPSIEADAAAPSRPFPLFPHMEDPSPSAEPTPQAPPSPPPRPVLASPPANDAPPPPPPVHREPAQTSAARAAEKPTVNTPAPQTLAPQTLAPQTPALQTPATAAHANKASATKDLPVEPIPRRAMSARVLYAALTALGACLLVAAMVLILGGKASFGNLGLGVVGVLLMTPGVYGLLGPARPPA